MTINKTSQSPESSGAFPQYVSIHNISPDVEPANRQSIFSSFFHRNSIDMDAIALMSENNTTLTTLNLTTETEKAPTHIELEECFEQLSILDKSPESIIYRAHDRCLNRIVAVKSLNELLSHQEEARKNFLAESALLAQLDHPAIIPVYGVFQDKDQTLHCAMKLVDGKSMHEYLEKLGSLYAMLPGSSLKNSEHTSLPKRLNMFLHVCDAINFAHHKGVYHRNLHTDNILIGQYGEVYVMDWSTAGKIATGTIDFSTLIASSPQNNACAPEVLAGQEFNQRSEIYALGRILFELVYLQTPEQARKKNAAGSSAANAGTPPSFCHRFGCRVTPDLRAIIAKAINPNPSQRYRDILELIEDIRHVQNREPVSARPLKWHERIPLLLLRNRQIAMLCLSMLLIALLALGSFTLVRELSVRQQAHIRDNILSKVYTNGLHSGMLFNQKIRDLEAALRLFAAESSILLDNREPVDHQEHFYSYRCQAEGNELPEDYTYSPTYHQKVALSNFVYKESPQTPIPDVRNWLLRLAPLNRSFQRILCTACANNDQIDPFLDFSEAIQHQILQEKRPPLSFVYLSLSNGLHLSYPFHTDYQDSYDPRRRPWYLEAAQSKPGSVLWTAPYIDNGEVGDLVITCAQGVFDRDMELLGCCACDISLERLLEIMRHTGNSGDYIETKMLLDSNGNILADISGKKRPLRGEISVEFQKIDNPAIFESMWEHQLGLRLYEEPEGRKLYFYMHVDSLNWLYLERIDYDRLLSSFLPSQPEKQKANR